MEVEGETRRRWDDLAMDCLATIFSKLNLEDKTLSIPFVCKSWHAASLHSDCWKILNFRELNLMPWSNFNAKFSNEYRIKNFSFSGFMKLVIARSSGMVVELTFPSMMTASTKDLLYASTECPRLRRLELPDMLHEEEKQIPGILANWKELEQLDTRLKPHCFPEILALVGRSCRNFTSLRTYGCFNHDDVKAIITHVPKLKFLSMSGSYLQREQLCMLLDGCGNLEGLNLSKCRGVDVDDEMRKKASNIRCFECAGCKLREEYWDDVDDCYDILWAIMFGGK